MVTVQMPYYRLATEEAVGASWIPDDWRSVVLKVTDSRLVSSPSSIFVDGELSVIQIRGKAVSVQWEKRRQRRLLL